MKNDQKSNQNPERLFKAIAQNDLTQIKLLIEAGVNVNLPLICSTTHLKQSPLEVAIAYRNIEIVKMLLAAGAYLHGFLLDIALNIALDENSSELLEAVIAANIDVNLRFGEDEDTALMVAASAGAINIVKLLVEAGSNINLTNRLGRFALLLAAYGGWLEVYEFLRPLTIKELVDEAEKSLSSGLIYRQRTNDRLLDNFITSAISGDIKSLLVALKDGVDINAFDATGCTALYHASGLGRVEIVRILIEAKAFLEIGCEHDRQTPLIRAAGELAGSNSKYAGSNSKYFDEMTQLEVIRLLIEAGANVNACASDGWTALMGAANAGNSEAVKMLLLAQADVNVGQDSGDTALFLAKSLGHVEIVELLKDAGAKDN